MTFLITFLVVTNIAFLLYIVRLERERGGICKPKLVKAKRTPADLVAKEIIHSLVNDHTMWKFTEFDAIHLKRKFEIWRCNGKEGIKLKGSNIFTPNQKEDIFQAINDCMCNQILDDSNQIALEELAQYNKELLEG